MLQDGQASAVHLFHVLDPRDVIDHQEEPALGREEVVTVAPGLCCARHRPGVSRRSKPTCSSTPARIGRPVPVLVQLRGLRADLLIVGTHARRGVERLLLGSVAEALVREAPCPVLVARPVDYSGRSKTQLPDAPYRAGEAPTPSAVPFERTVSTTADNWRPSDNGPTGIRTV